MSYSIQLDPVKYPSKPDGFGNAAIKARAGEKRYQKSFDDRLKAISCIGHSWAGGQTVILSNVDYNETNNKHESGPKTGKRKGVSDSHCVDTRFAVIDVEQPKESLIVLTMEQIREAIVLSGLYPLYIVETASSKKYNGSVRVRLVYDMDRSVEPHKLAGYVRVIQTELQFHLPPGSIDRGAISPVQIWNGTYTIGHVYVKSSPLRIEDLEKYSHYSESKPRGKSSTTVKLVTGEVVAAEGDGCLGDLPQGVEEIPVFKALLAGESKIMDLSWLTVATLLRCYNGGPELYLKLIVGSGQDKEEKIHRVTASADYHYLLDTDSHWTPLGYSLITQIENLRRPKTQRLKRPQQFQQEALDKARQGTKVKIYAARNLKGNVCIVSPTGIGKTTACIDLVKEDPNLVLPLMVATIELRNEAERKAIAAGLQPKIYVSLSQYEDEITRCVGKSIARSYKAEYGYRWVYEIMEHNFVKANQVLYTKLKKVIFSNKIYKAALKANEPGLYLATHAHCFGEPDLYKNVKPYLDDWTLSPELRFAIKHHEISGLSYFTKNRARGKKHQLGGKTMPQIEEWCSVHERDCRGLTHYQVEDREILVWAIPTYKEAFSRFANGVVVLDATAKEVVSDCPIYDHFLVEKLDCTAGILIWLPTQSSRTVRKKEGNQSKKNETLLCGVGFYAMSTKDETADGLAYMGNCRGYDKLNGQKVSVNSDCRLGAETLSLMVYQITGRKQYLNPEDEMLQLSPHIETFDDGSRTHLHLCRDPFIKAMQQHTMRAEITQMAGRSRYNVNPNAVSVCNTILPPYDPFVCVTDVMQILNDLSPEQLDAAAESAILSMSDIKRKAAMAKRAAQIPTANLPSTALGPVNVALLPEKLYKSVKARLRFAQEECSEYDLIREVIEVREIVLKRCGPGVFRPKDV